MLLLFLLFTVRLAWCTVDGAALDPLEYTKEWLKAETAARAGRCAWTSGGRFAGSESAIANTTTHAHSTALAMRDCAVEHTLLMLSLYFSHAFPAPELLPLSRRGRVSFTRGRIDDVLDHYPITALDSLDVLWTMGFTSQHSARGRNIVCAASLAVADATDFSTLRRPVSTFETAIRALGGLETLLMILERERAHERTVSVTSHEEAGLPTRGECGRAYTRVSSLLRDLARRLLPAFRSPTGIPYSRVVLGGPSPGVQAKDTIARENNVAGAGTIALEMRVASALTGDPRFAAAATDTVNALWARRSSLHLFGSSLAVESGQWLSPTATIGANGDSFYESLAKCYALFGDRTSLSRFNRAYHAVETNLKTRGGWYTEATMGKGVSAGHRVGTAGAGPFRRIADSLSAFWPAVQVLAGDVDDAERSFANLFRVFRLFNGSLPERYSVTADWLVDGVPSVRRTAQEVAFDPNPAADMALRVDVGSGLSAMRPELLESAYHLYVSTRRLRYLEAGASIFRSLLEKHRIPGEAALGFAAVTDFRRGVLEDRLDSFVLSETFKYAFLLADAALPRRLQVSPLSREAAAHWVFTTEGHAMSPTELAAIAKSKELTVTVVVPPPTPPPKRRVQMTTSNNSTSSGNSCPCGCGMDDAESAVHTHHHLWCGRPTVAPPDESNAALWWRREASRALASSSSAPANTCEAVDPSADDGEETVAVPLIVRVLDILPTGAPLPEVARQMRGTIMADSDVQQLLRVVRPQVDAEVAAESAVLVSLVDARTVDEAGWSGWTEEGGEEEQARRPVHVFGADAAFGAAPPGPGAAEPLCGRLVRATDERCGPARHDRWRTEPPATEPWFAVYPRGSCYFAEKALIGAAAGASATLVVDVDAATVEPDAFMAGLPADHPAASRLDGALGSHVAVLVPRSVWQRASRSRVTARGDGVCLLPNATVHPYACIRTVSAAEAAARGRPISDARVVIFVGLGEPGHPSGTVDVDGNVFEAAHPLPSSMDLSRVYAYARDSLGFPPSAQVRFHLVSP